MIADALFRLMKRKPFPQITVTACTAGRKALLPCLSGQKIRWSRHTAEYITAGIDVIVRIWVTRGFHERLKKLQRLLNMPRTVKHR